jgi:peptide/nickel transport system permease protein
MGAYLLRRLVGAAFLLVLMSLAIYALIGLMPGDPLDLMLQADPHVTAADVARLKTLYGLDRPLLERWLAWLVAIAHGDFGYSRLYAVPAVQVLWPRLLNTLLLMGTSLFAAAALAFPAGIAAARRPGGRADRVIRLLASAGQAMPSFWLAFLLIILFAVELGWLPAGGSQGAAATGIQDRLRHLALPALTLTLVTAAALVRYVRAAVEEALREPFIRTARAKGCGGWGVVMRHALPQALPALATLVALHLGQLFSGALVVETVFSYLGMGKLIYDSILGNDYNLALLALMLATLMILLANLVADLAVAWLDPRVRYGD